MDFIEKCHHCAHVHLEIKLDYFHDDVFLKIKGTCHRFLNEYDEISRSRKIHFTLLCFSRNKTYTLYHGQVKGFIDLCDNQKYKENVTAKEIKRLHLSFVQEYIVSAF